MHNGRESHIFITTAQYRSRTHSMIWIVFLLLGCAVADVKTAASGYSISDSGWTFMECSDSLTVYASGKPAGRLLHRVRVDTENRSIRQTSSATFGNGGMQVDESSIYDWSGALVEARQTMTSPAGENRWLLKKNEHGKWVLRVTAGGMTTSKEVPVVSSNLMVSRNIMVGVRENTIRQGDIWRDTLFSLTSAKNVAVTTECRKIPDDNDSTWVFVNKDELTKTDEVWEIDRRGRLFRREIPPMFTAFRESSAQQNGSGEEMAVDQLSEMFHIPARRHGDDEHIVVTGDSSLQLHSSVKSFYRSVDGGFRLCRLPSECSEAETAVDTSLVRATPSMQVEARLIRDLADSLSRGVENDRCEVVKRVWQYVFRTIEKRNVATFSSALETLSAGYGDCGEHAVTLGAILRAAGIPARVVLGLVYMGHKKGYYYHAWVMVRQDGGWLFVDPALGRYPAVNGYIPLVVDDTGEDAAFLARYIGKIEVSYVPRSDDSRGECLE